MRFLRTNTAVMVTVGPFYDKTDGVTIETALTITNERITLTADTDASSAPTNILDNVTGATSGTANDLNYITGNDAGMMQLELAAADTNRLGRMMLSITDAANHVPVFHEFMVLPAMIYDAFVLGTDVLDASMTQILGTAVSSPATAGILDVNVKNIDNDAASASGTVTFPNATLASTVNITAAAGCAVSSIGNNVLTAASTSADYLAEINAEVDTAIADVGLTTTITGRIDAAITTRASQTSLDTVDDFLDTEVAAIKAKTDNLPSDPADASDVAGAFATVNTKLDTIDDFLDTEIAAITSKLNGVVIAQGTIGATGNDTTHIHLTGLPYGDDEINNHLLVIFDVSASEYHARWITDWADTGDLATVATLPFTPQNSTDTYWLLPIRQDVTGGSGLDAAGVRAAVGLSSANLDTQLSAIDDFIDTEVAAIKAKTDNLPSDPADASDIAGAFSTLSAKVDVIDDFLDTEVAAIKAKTDQFTFTTANRVDAQVFGIQANAITAASTAADYLAEINAEVDTAIADVGLTTTITGRIDAAITTRASQTSVDTIDDFLDTEVGLILAAVDTEVAAIKAVTDLFVTAHAEPTGTPAANATPLVKLAWLFMALRNQVDVTASKKQFYDDGGSVEWEKDLSDDGTTFTESEANAP